MYLPIGANLIPMSETDLAIGNAETPVPEFEEDLSLFCRCKEATYALLTHLHLPAKRALLPAYKACNFIPVEGGQPAPIAMAISHGNAAIVKLILDAGFDPNKKGTGKRRADDPALHTAAKAGNAAIVKMLLEAGADKNAVNYDGQTAAEVAAPEVADLLR